MTTSNHKNFFLFFPPVIFLLMALIITWPLLTHIQDRVPGWYVGDNYEYIWKMWWFKHALVDQHTSPLIAPSILIPTGFPLAFAEITPLHTLLALPLTVVFGEVMTYNLLALASFVLAGWTTYLLVLMWTQNPWAGMFTGVLILFNPYHIVRYTGHLPLMSIEGIPIFLLGMEGWVKSRKPAWIFLAGLGYLLTAWASIYYAFGLLVLAPVYILVRLLGIRNKASSHPKFSHMAILILLILVITIPLAIPYLELRGVARLSIPLQDTNYWSASITDYILPSGLHPIWGNWVIKNMLGVPPEYPHIALEFVITSGFAALLFAVYGSIKSPASPKWALLAFTGIAFILSLGPTLHIARHQVVIPAPSGIVLSFNHLMDSIGAMLPAHERYTPLGADGLTVPLPALILRWVVEPLTGMRGWNRLAAFTGLGIALLAGLGFDYWMVTELKPKRPTTRVALTSLAIIVLAIFELWPRPIPLHEVGPRPIDVWLAAQPDQGSIMELPLTSALSAPQMLYTRYHGRPIAFAYGTYLPYWYREEYPELDQCPQAACLERLREWRISLVLLNLRDPSGGPTLEAELDQSPGLERITTVGDHIVYRLLY